MQCRGLLSINSTFFAGASRLFMFWKFNIASAQVPHIVDLRSPSKNTLWYDLLCFPSQEIGTRGKKWTLWEKLLERNGVIISFSTTDKLSVALWASLPPSALVTEMGYDDCALLPARLWTLFSCWTPTKFISTKSRQSHSAPSLQDPTVCFTSTS